MADRVLFVAIPLVAIMVFGVVFYASSTRTLAMSTQTRLSIRIVPRNLTATPTTIVPTPNIGIPGGVMATTRYLQDGINGFYPLHTSRVNPGIIYVDSQVVRTYTLGDFFEVWGKPLGPTNTMGVAENFTSAGKDFFWDMCIRNPGPAQVEFPTFEWGSHVLRNGEVIDLVYSNAGCG